MKFKHKNMHQRVQIIVEFDYTLVIFVFTVLKYAPNLKTSVYKFSGKLGDVLPCSLVSTYKHKLEESFTVVVEEILLNKVRNQV